VLETKNYLKGVSHIWPISIIKDKLNYVPCKKEDGCPMVLPVPVPTAIWRDAVSHVSGAAAASGATAAATAASPITRAFLVPVPVPVPASSSTGSGPIECQCSAASSTGGSGAAGHADPASGGAGAEGPNAVGIHANAGRLRALDTERSDGLLPSAGRL